MSSIEIEQAKSKMLRVDLKEYLKTVEKKFIVEFLTACDGNIKLAAEYLMMNRTTLYFRMKRLGLTQWIKEKGDTSQ